MARGQLPGSPWNRDFAKGFPVTGEEGAVMGPNLTSIDGGNTVTRAGWYLHDDYNNVRYFKRGEKVPGDRQDIWLFVSEKEDATEDDIREGIRLAGWRGNFDNLVIEH